MKKCKHKAAKFVIGDWIVKGNTTKRVDEVVTGNRAYYLLHNGGKLYSHDEDKWKKWTIDDSKKGDFLCAVISEDEYLPFIYNGELCNETIQYAGAYCGIGRFGFNSKYAIRWYPVEHVVPATLEQIEELRATIKLYMGGRMVKNVLLQKNMPPSAKEFMFAATKRERELEAIVTSNVEHPSHYKQEGRKECIEEMLEKFGENAVFIWCALNHYKYNYRKGTKEGNTEEQDVKKGEWYINFADKLAEPHSEYATVITYVKEHKKG